MEEEAEVLRKELKWILEDQVHKVLQEVQHTLQSDNTTCSGGVISPHIITHKGTELSQLYGLMKKDIKMKFATNANDYNDNDQHQHQFSCDGKTDFNYPSDGKYALNYPSDGKYAINYPSDGKCAINFPSI
ncbi:Hypothetical predicted protein [Mytilus galloprovincialis]|uniref:Uncharacterized protein n=1 Tax=Mytilus galloprovincialis TaxID=29158 RepID=A0A8B6FPF8_MYTGA|nr:Hypothetical predicted protein [Mytilus galloprovincialis]